MPDVLFSKMAWFKVGWDLFEMQFPLVEHDFWIPTKESWRSTPPDYARSLQWMHHLVWSAGKENCLSKARATMLDQAVHCKCTEPAIGVQANRKNPGQLVLKYTRSRSSLPALMIKDLVAEVAKDFELQCA